MAGKPRTVRSRGESVERILARTARQQHGIISREQALNARITRYELEQRIESGLLVPVHRGVYRLGHQAPSDHADYFAAVKACGDWSGLSGFAGAHLLDIVRNRPTRVEVTSARDRSVRGLIVHRARRTDLQLTNKHGIPVTTPAWTLLDIASRLDDEHLGRACHDAWVHHRCGLPAVVRALALRGKVPGSRRLLRILGGDDPTFLSRLEKAFYDLLREEKRELPVTNVRVGSHRVDCHWPHLKLIVELDSYRFHGSRRAWEKDRERDREARRRGEELIRYTWGDVYGTPDDVRAEMRARLPLAG